MASIKRALGKKAAKATFRHSARGVAAKAQRKPLRSGGLLGAGALIGLAAGWLAGRKTAPHDHSHS
ncbi:MAG: hypothetical protein ACYCU0_03620 [Solirubrobacteraceae bacterium]